ncbi:MAG: glyoxylate/hydroxypyruvate reductase A [Hyphomicrobiaceae bacterium]
MSLLLLGPPERGAVWSGIFRAAGEELVLGEAAVADPAAITHLACWEPPADLGIYPNLRVVLSVGAGVDQMPALPAGVRLARTLAPGIEAMMRDWTVMAVLALHRDLPAYLEKARRGDWQPGTTLPASARRVGIMGMGRIGRLSAEALTGLGFKVSGWSRSGRPVASVTMHGEGELPRFLASTDILVCLLPLTDDTRGIIDGRLLAALPAGARFAHAGRGGHLDMVALRQALDSGRLTGAMLDVTDPEPLPAEHWLWRHPRAIVTPHVGAHTDAVEGARHALAVIDADRRALPLPGLVDPARGY